LLPPHQAGGDRLRQWTEDVDPLVARVAQSRLLADPAGALPSAA
jgi:hypothetical protein